MFYRTLLLLLVGIILHTGCQQLLGDPIEIPGVATNCLQPLLVLEKVGADWNIEIDYVAQTNFPAHAWLKLPDRNGSKLQLWSTNMSLSTTMGLPIRTTVVSVLDRVRPHDRRGLQWLWTQSGTPSAATAFNLGSLFNVSFTNDIVLQITPMLYKVDANEVTARMVEFSPIKMKLASDGEVHSIK